MKISTGNKQRTKKENGKILFFLPQFLILLLFIIHFVCVRISLPFYFCISISYVFEIHLYFYWCSGAVCFVDSSKPNQDPDMCNAWSHPPFLFYQNSAFSLMRYGGASVDGSINLIYPFEPFELFELSWESSLIMSYICRN